MNQDQLADKLRTLADVPPFTLVFSGKKSKKVDGLYKPAEREILIHNKNMSGDSDLIYTAIHEFAHHIVSDFLEGFDPESGVRVALCKREFHIGEDLPQKVLQNVELMHRRL